MTNAVLTRRQRRDAKQAVKSAKKAKQRQNAELNRCKKRSAIIFGIVMTEQPSPAVDTLEYLALKMILSVWPSAKDNPAKGLSKLDVAVLTAKSILRSSHRFSDSQIFNAVFIAQCKIDRAKKIYNYHETRHQLLPMGFLEASIEHSLVHADVPWRELMNEAK